MSQEALRMVQNGDKEAREEKMNWNPLSITQFWVAGKSVYYTILHVYFSFKDKQTENTLFKKSPILWKTELKTKNLSPKVVPIPSLSNWSVPTWPKQKYALGLSKTHLLSRNIPSELQPQ